MTETEAEAKPINFSDYFYDVSDPIERLLRLGRKSIENGEGLQEEYTNDYIDDLKDMYKEEYPNDKRLQYREVAHFIGETFGESVHEDDDFLNVIYGYGNDLLAASKEVSPIVLEIFGIYQLVADKGKWAYDCFEASLKYSMYEPWLDELHKFRGQEAVLKFKKESELKLKDYENAFEEITCFTEYIEESQIGNKLAELGARLKAYCTLKITDPNKLKEDTPRKNMTLLQFMRRYCEKQKLQLLKYRRKSLNDANVRKTIALPKHVGEWKSGRKKYYKVSDLTKNWPSYREILPNLPPLKQNS